MPWLRAADERPVMAAAAMLAFVVPRGDSTVLHNGGCPFRCRVAWGLGEDVADREGAHRHGNLGGPLHTVGLHALDAHKESTGWELCNVATAEWDGTVGSWEELHRKGVEPRATRPENIYSQENSIPSRITWKHKGCRLLDVESRTGHGK